MEGGRFERSVRTAGPVAGRDAAFDLLRCIALVRIVLWHLFAQTWMTWFAAIPVLFFVAGSLLERPGDHLTFVRRRLRRILLPLWVYGAAVAAAFVWFARPSATGPRSLLGALSWVVPVVDPSPTGWDAGWLSNHLWYLRAYLWVIVLTPVLVRLSRRLVATVVGAVAAVIGLELAARLSMPAVGSGMARIVIGDVIVYGFFAVLGISYRRSTRTPDRRWLAVAAVVSAFAAVVYAATVGLPSEGVNGSYPAIVLVGCAWLAGLGAVEPWLREVAGRPDVRRVARAVSSRSLTVYLWHPVCIVAARRLVPVTGLIGVVAVIAVTAVLTLLAVAVFGWVEAVASGRRVGARPVGRRAAGGAVMVPMLLAIALPVIGGRSAPLAVAATRSPFDLGIPAPSAREALGDDAFAPAVEPVTVPTTAVQDSMVPQPISLAFTTPEVDAQRWVMTEPIPTAPPTLPASGAPSTTVAAAPSMPIIEVQPVRTPNIVRVRTKRSRSRTTPATTTTRPARTGAQPSARSATPAVAPAALAAPATPGPPPTAPARFEAGVPAPATTSPVASAPLALPTEALQRALDAWRAGAEPGASSVVVALRSGNQTWTASSTDGVTPSKYQADAPMLAASITKTFTAALVLREVEKGTIDLDGPAPQLAGLDVAVPSGVTVRRLLTHTAGLVDYSATPGYRSDQPLTAGQAVALSFSTPLKDGLGSTVRYANSGYLYLGLLLEQVTGKSYSALVAGLADDAGLQTTSVDVGPHPGWIGFSSGGLVSTAGELARWGQALYTPGKILSARMSALMTTIGDMNLGLGAWPACPCSTDSKGVKRYTAIGHNTATGGMFYFPATGITMVVMFEPVPNDIVGLMDALNKVIVGG